MAEYLGDFTAGSVIKFKFNTRTASGAPITFAGTPQVAIYKDSVTQTTTGVTQPSVDYDGVTGLHYVVIDTADAFYETGKDYDVVVTAGTVDGQSVVGETIRTFSIENRNIKANVTQISGDSVAADNAEAFFDGTGYAGTNNVMPTVTNLTNLPSIPSNWITAAGVAADAVTEIQSGLATASGVSAVEAKVDIVDAVVDSIQVDTDNIQTRIPAALVGGRMDSSVGAMANDVITSSAIAASAVTEIQSGLATASQIPAEFTSAAFASTGVFATAALANAPSGSGPSAADIADAVWDENLASHLTAGSTGAALNAAGGAGDPWITTLPGTYTGDQAGAILDAIRDKTALITGSDMFIAVDRVTNGTITMYKNESTSVTVPLSEDTTSKTLRFTVEDAYGTDILTIANASITRNASSFTVTIPSTVTDELANHTWALRDITGGINRLVRKGVLTVQAAADNDA